MRILYFSRAYTTHDRRFLSKISRHHEVFYLKCENDEAAHDSRPLPDRVTLMELRLARGESSAPVNHLRGMPEYQAIVDHIRPDLIHAGPVQLCGFMTALLGFHPFLAASWGFDILVDAYRDPLSRWLTRHTLQNSDMLLCDCAEVAAKAGELANYPQSAVVRFPWGVELSNFRGVRSSVLRKERGWSDAIIALSTRTWRDDYGTDTLLNAFRIAHEQEPRLRLAMLGDGPMAPEVRAYIVQHGLSDAVRLVGLKPEDELPGFYASADLYISTTPNDGSSVSLLGALASGLPVIVSDQPSNREWINPGENGWLAPPQRVEAFAAALVSAATLQLEEREVIATANRRLATERADWDRNFPQLLAAYDRLHSKYGLKGFSRSYWS